MYSGLVNVIISIFIIETLSWVFSLLLNEAVFKYLSLQRLFLFIGIVSILFRPLVFVVALLFKIGIPPFHLWVFNISYLINKNTFLILTTLHKLFPLFFLSKVIFLKTFIIIINTIIFLFILLFLQYKNMLLVMTLSSFTHSIWLLVCGILKLSLILVYWVFYSAFYTIMLYSFSVKVIKYSDETQSSFSSIIWLIMSGFPPFTIFWLKITLFVMLLIYRIISRYFTILVSVIRIVAYYRIFNLSLIGTFIYKKLFLLYIFFPFIFLWL